MERSAMTDVTLFSVIPLRFIPAFVFQVFLLQQPSEKYLTLFFLGCVILTVEN
jgi:hypothetical protein